MTSADGEVSAGAPKSIARFAGLAGEYCRFVETNGESSLKLRTLLAELYAAACHLPDVGHSVEPPELEAALPD